MLNGDPTVIGKTIRLGPGTATIVGVLEPSVPYPAETEIIANVVTSPHHLGATMQNERWHRMTELFGRLAPGATLEGARAELKVVHASMVHAHPEAYSASAQGPARGHDAPRSAHVARADDPPAAPGGGGGRFRDRVLERRQPDSEPVGSPRRRARRARRARRHPGRAPAHAARGEPRPLCRGRRARPAAREAARGRGGPLCRALLRPRAGGHGGHERALARGGTGAGGGGAAGVRATAPLLRSVERSESRWRRDSDHARHEPPSQDLRDDADCVLLPAARGRRHAGRDVECDVDGEDRLRHAAGPGGRRPAASARRRRRSDGRLLPGRHAADRRAAGRGGRRVRDGRALARRVELHPEAPVRVRGVPARQRRGQPDLHVPARLASVLRRARCSDRHGPRLHGRGRSRYRGRRHRQPERGAAPLPERRSGQPAPVARQPHRPRAQAAPHRRRRRRRGRRKRRAGADDDGIPPVAAVRGCRAACSSAPQPIRTRSCRP